MENLVFYGSYKIKYDRIRYGDVPYTYAFVEAEGEWRSLGNPVQGGSWEPTALHDALEKTLGHAVVSPAADRLDEVAGAVRQFLRSSDLTDGGLIFYTPEEWREKYAHGRAGMVAAVHIEDNPLYQMVNGAYPDAGPQLSKFSAYLAEQGFTFEPMQAWAIAIYPA